MMTVNHGFYFETLYPFQDRVLRAITGAQRKAAGIFPVDLAQLLLSVTSADWESVRWITAPPVEQFSSDLKRLGEALIVL